MDARFVQDLAALARLDLDAPTALRMANELSRILAYVEQIGEQGSVGDPGGALRWREDLPHLTDAEAVLAQCGHRQGQSVAIPPVRGVDT